MLDFTLVYAHLFISRYNRSHSLAHSIVLAVASVRSPRAVLGAAVACRFSSHRPRSLFDRRKRTFLVISWPLFLLHNYSTPFLLPDNAIRPGRRLSGARRPRACGCQPGVLSIRNTATPLGRGHSEMSSVEFVRAEYGRVLRARDRFDILFASRYAFRSPTSTVPRQRLAVRNKRAGVGGPAPAATSRLKDLPSPRRRRPSPAPLRRGVQIASNFSIDTQC
ncbi:hypothetical protein EVAR_33929_1 [Eumeta japonica]|uniref:Uncharacterized protein n=1 Tax=Eumeta variegata TaxID=151549 RepID=A0A4C1VX54_EUMVA|nr:hypothetical protein EVAR_33929_1 [Eumeta japonica]